MPDAPHVVIIGGGFGGLAAAQALKHAPVRVTLLDRRNHHLFQPLLYQVATAGLSPGDIAAPIRWILRKQPNVRVLLAEARAIDAASRTVTLDRGSIRYDYLIVASGATHAYFGHPEWEAFAPGLKSLDDALEIRRRTLLAYEIAEREDDLERRRRLLTFVVIGGGPTGVEMAGAIAEIASHTLAHEFRHDLDGDLAGRADRGRAEHPLDLPRRPAAGRAPLSRAAARRGLDQHARDRH